MNGPQQGAGYKVALLLARDPAIAAEDFATRWLSATAPAGPQGLRQRVFNAAIVADMPIENAPPAPFDAVDEFIFGHADQAAEWFGSSDFREAWLGPRLALLGQPVQSISGQAANVWNGGRPSPVDAVKILTLPIRRPGMVPEDFAHHWLVIHAGLALAGPNARERLVRLVSTPADRQAFPAITVAPFDGIGVIEFDSAESLAAEFASDHYRQVMAPDEPRFTDPANSRAIMVNERDVPALARG